MHPKSQHVARHARTDSRSTHHQILGDEIPTDQFSAIPPPAVEVMATVVSRIGDEATTAAAIIEEILQPTFNRERRPQASNPPSA